MLKYTTETIFSLLQITYIYLAYNLGMIEFLNGQGPGPNGPAAPLPLSIWAQTKEFMLIIIPVITNATETALLNNLRRDHCNITAIQHKQQF